MGKPIQIKDPPEELRARLIESAERNFRSLPQEVQARLEFSFDLEEALQARIHQKWIDEAFQTGKLGPGSVARLKEIAARAGAVAK